MIYFKRILFFLSATVVLSMSLTRCIYESIEDSASINETGTGIETEEGTEEEQPTVTGTLNLKFTTKATNGQFSPRHLLAVWITKQDGNFLKTLLLNAQNQHYIHYLGEWNSYSNGNKTDAITGATLSQHKEREITWDCLDVNGNTIPDGTYKVWIEMTEANANGPKYSFTFTKGAAKDSAKMPDQTYFKDIYKVYKQ